MNINNIIIYILVIFMTLGAIDKCLNNRFGLGAKFDEGFMTMGSLAIALIGMISFAPVLANILKPILLPVYSFLGTDPSVFATSILANDMGGYALAQKLAENPESGLFSGLILGSMMGATIVFTIPVAMGLIRKEDHKFFTIGIIAGLITIPLGCFVAGLIAGFQIPMLLSNLVPIVLISIILSIALLRFPSKTMLGFAYFARAIVVLATLSTAAIVIETLTGLIIIPGMTPISEAIQTIGSITIILIGAYPMIFIITKIWKKSLARVGIYLGINDVSTIGMIASLANSIPMFGMIKDMDNKGKVLNVAFAVSAAFVFGDHLGFTAGVNKEMIFPVIVGKLIAGLSAIILANFLIKKNKGLILEDIVEC